MPENVSEKYDYIINFQTFLTENTWISHWGNYGAYTYIMLRPDASPAAVEKKITHFLDKYDVGQSASFKVELGMQPFDEMYLHSNFKAGKPDGGRIQYVYLFTIVAVFILLIACVNFMNLTTARSLKRAREIGIRKVIGAFRPALIVQFMGEAMFLTMISTAIALLLVTAVLPFFNQLTGKQIALPTHHWSYWMSLAGIVLVTGIISGSYPALFLSSFRPVKVLKGAVKFSTANTLFRKGLVVFQFVLSIVLIVATIVVSGQIRFIQSSNLGYDRENLVYITLNGDLLKKYEVFKTEAAKLPGITAVSRMSEQPTDLASATFVVDWPGKDPKSSSSFKNASVGYDFVKTLKLQIIQGRDFSKDFAAFQLHA